MARTPELSPEIAEILGAFIGDGWIEKRGTALYIAGSPIEDREYYNFVLGPLISSTLTPVKPRLFPYWGVYGIAIYRRKVIKTALDLGFCPGRKARVVAIPDYVLNMDENILKAVLRGIFDTDGTFYCMKAYGKYYNEWAKTHHYQPRLAIGIVSESLSTQIRTLLQRFEIEHRFSVTKGGFRNQRNNAPTFRIWVNKRASIERWFSIIGTSNPRHRTRFEVWKRYGHLPPKTTIEDRHRILSEQTNFV